MCLGVNVRVFSFVQDVVYMVVVMYMCNIHVCPLQIDVVYIGTIHPTHLRVAQQMLYSGKPVLCEKPLTMNALDTASLIQSATKSGVFLMEVRTFTCTCHLSFKNMYM